MREWALGYVKLGLRFIEADATWRNQACLRKGGVGLLEPPKRGASDVSKAGAKFSW